MKIAAYNLNSINARIENLTAWLAKAAPDVVLVQEIKSEYNNFPFFELRAAGYEAKMLGQKSYNGVAVLSRHPLSVVREGLPDFDDENARYLETEVSVQGQKWRLASIYLPNGNPPYNDVADRSKYLYKLEWMNAFLRHAADLRKLDCPVVLGGDFNVILTENDVYDPKPLPTTPFSPGSAAQAERPVPRRFLRRVSHPASERPGYTFWDYTGNALAADFGMRIDYLFLNAPAVDRLLSCTVDKAHGWRPNPPTIPPLLPSSAHEKT